MPSRKIDDLQVTITSAGVELAQDGVGVVQVDAGSIMRLIDALQDAWYQHAAGRFASTTKASSFFGFSGSSSQR